MQNQNKILREQEIIAVVGVGRTCLRDMQRDGTFPPYVRLSPRSVGVPESEVGAYIAAKVAGVDDEGMRRLVKKLKANRLEIFADIAQQLGGAA